MKKFYYYLITIGMSSMFVSCTHEVIDEASTTDTELESALTVASKGQGLTFYKFPASTDYSLIPQDPKNPITKEKVELGKMLFHETGLGQRPVQSIGLQTYSCASCHHAKAGFQACVPQGMGEGAVGFGVQGESRVPSPQYNVTQIDFQQLRSPSALNIAYQTNVLWNGQFGATGVNVGTQAAWTKGTPKEVNYKGFQGVETQAVAGRDVHRLLVDRIFMSNVGNYKELYLKAYDDASFNDAEQLTTNSMLAVAAYERTLLANEAPFQKWLSGNYSALTQNQKEGAILFFSKAECYKCHNGPSLANMEFYALGMSELQNGNLGKNKVIGIDLKHPDHKGRGGFTGKTADMYKFKVPQLYNLKDTPFYGHGASFTTVKSIIEYKNLAVAQNATVPKTQLAAEFKPLNLTAAEIDKLNDFIVNGLYDANLMRYVPKALPSKLAFPNNDTQSRLDLGF